MVTEWILRLESGESGNISGVMVAGADRIAVSGNLKVFRKDFRRELEKLQCMRNPYPGELPLKYEDHRGILRRIGEGVSSEFLSTIAIRKFSKLGSEEVRLVIESDDPAVHSIPWELMMLPEDPIPIAIKDEVKLIRRTSGKFTRNGSSKIPPPPLRIAFSAICPVDELPASRIDYDEELRLIDEALHSRRYGRVLAFPERPEIFESEDGSPEAIRTLLKETKAQILHLTGHGKGGLIYVERNDGTSQRLTGKEFYDQVLKDQEYLKLIFFSECESSLILQDRSGSAVLELSRYFPLVAGFQWAMGTEASMRFANSFYTNLAERPQDPIFAFSEARRTMFSWCAKNAGKRALGTEWATPVLFASQSYSDVLIKPEEKYFLPEEGVAIYTGDWETLLPVGSFVGRRSELRDLLQLIIHGEKPIVLIAGAGGLGKSSVAAKMSGIMRRKGFSVSVLIGDVNPGTVYSAIRKTIQENIEFNQSADRERFREKLRDFDKNSESSDMNDKLSTLIRHFCADIPTLLILDDFEKNLKMKEHFPLEDKELKRTLKILSVANADNMKTLITSRYKSRDLSDLAIEYDLPAFHEGEWLHLISRMERRFKRSIPDESRIELYGRFSGIPRLLEFFVAYYANALEKKPLGKALTFAAYLEKFEITPEPTNIDGGEIAALEATKRDILIEDLITLFIRYCGKNAEEWLRRVSLFALPVTIEGLSVMAIDKEEMKCITEWNEKACSLGLMLMLVERTIEMRETEPEKDRELCYLIHPALKDLFENKRPFDNNELSGLSEKATAYYRYRSQLKQIFDERELKVWRQHAMKSQYLDNAYEPTLRLAGIFFHFGRWQEGAMLLREVAGPEYPETLEKSKIYDLLGQFSHSLGEIVEAETWLSERKKLIDKFQVNNPRVSMEEILSERSGILQQTAIIQESRGNYDKAIEFLEESGRIYKELGNAREYSSILIAIARIESQQGNYDRAISLLENSLDIIKELGDLDAYITCLHQIAIIDSFRGDYDKAIILLEEVTRMEKELGHKQGHSASLHQMAVIECFRGNYDRAIELLNESIKIKEELGDKQGYCASLHHMALIEGYRANYEKALELLDEKTRIEKELQDMQGYAGSQYQMARIEEARGNYDRAVTLLGKARKIYKKSNDKRNYSGVIHQMAIIESFRGNYDKALELLEESMKIVTALGDRQGYSATLHQMGMIEEFRSNHDRAIELYEESRKMSLELGNNHDYAKSAFALAQAFIGKGAIEEAKKLIIESLRIARKLKDPILEAHNLNIIGQIAFSEEDVLTSLISIGRAAYLMQKSSHGDSARFSKTLEEMSQKLLELGERMGKASDSSALSIVNSLYLKGIVSLAHEQWERAQSLLSKALELTIAFNLGEEKESIGILLKILESAKEKNYDSELIWRELLELVKRVQITDEKISANEEFQLPSEKSIVEMIREGREGEKALHELRDSIAHHKGRIPGEDSLKIPDIPGIDDEALQIWLFSALLQGIEEEKEHKGAVSYLAKEAERLLNKNLGRKENLLILDGISRAALENSHRENRPLLKLLRAHSRLIDSFQESAAIRIIEGVLYNG